MKSWIGTSLTAIVGTGLVFYGIAYLAMRVPLARLWKPYGIISILMGLLGPSMYWATTRLSLKWSVCVFGVYFWLIVLVYLYSSVQLKIIPPEALVPVDIIATITTAMGCVGGYYSVKNLFTD